MNTFLPLLIISRNTGVTNHRRVQGNYTQGHPISTRDYINGRGKSLTVQTTLHRIDFDAVAQVGPPALSIHSLHRWAN
ncbi:hypothetical protein AWB74_08538 [Caballeronia arvi]|uniref:Uncharacterized protein n=1 Tax=Caballeronia arvi TaxID=1777135 RepID=A0A158L532_9BURK|nr:hypothetical protein [Caballeronia arvi]SAL88385.1 hypothetical protein AWB74_08538 [Caballeronia arvi]